MNKEDVLKVIKQIRETSKKRKFIQSFDLVFNLKGIDYKKEDKKINTYITLPHSKGKKVIVAALVGNELFAKAKGSCDKAIHSDEFKTLDKKTLKKLTQEVDFFIAQANIMPQVATTFGRVLGPRGLMPNPKADCVVPPTADLKPIAERLQKTIRLETKNEPTIKAMVGTESMKDEEITENILAIYNNLINILPDGKVNIKNALLKLTMDKPIIIGATEEKK